jgi:hypothetical protein
VFSRRIFFSVRKSRRIVIDTSNIYVRGEENLQGWKPKGPSIIDEHQKQLHKLERIQEVPSLVEYYRLCTKFSML